MLQSFFDLPNSRQVEAAYSNVFKEINKAIALNSMVLVGIDGPCAAGKSSLAKAISKVYNCGIIHVDDFFLQPHQCSKKRLEEIGGNVDYERLAPVVAKACKGKAFSYQAYNCKSQKMDALKDIPPASVTVLEGSYSLHPKIGAQCHVRIFLTVDGFVQMQRILNRSGKIIAKRFEKDWIPMENQYFKKYKIKENCHLEIDTSALF